MLTAQVNMSLSQSFSQESDQHAIKVTKIILNLEIKGIHWMVVEIIILARREMASAREIFLYLIAKMSVSNVMPISLTILWSPSEEMKDNARALASVGRKLSKTKTIV